MERSTDNSERAESPQTFLFEFEMHNAYFCIGFTFLITVCSGLCSILFAFSELTLVGGEGHALETRGDHQVETRRTTPPWEDRYVYARAPS